MKLYTEFVHTPNTHLNNVSGLYLHGEAENTAGFDCVSGERSENPLPIGISNVTVVFPDGERECFAFVSICPLRGKKGLIVFGDDLEAIQYASGLLTDTTCKI